jgi:hypothetical protein
MDDGSDKGETLPAKRGLALVVVSRAFSGSACGGG